MRPAQLVPFFLMASYLYYLHDISIMDDRTFDWLCRRLDKEWREVEHPHKHLIERGSKGAFHLREQDYPLMCRNAAWSYAERYINSTYHYKRPSNTWLKIHSHLNRPRFAKQLRLRLR